MSKQKFSPVPILSGCQTYTAYLYFFYGRILKGLDLIISPYSVAFGVILSLLFFLYGLGYLNAGWCDRREILAYGRANTRDGNEVVWGLAAPGRRKKRQMKFSLLWESMGNFCILAVFERYLSNACTDPHQILFV